VGKGEEVDYNAKTPYGEGSLYITSRNGHQGVVQLLRQQKNFEIETKTALGDTPLHGASFSSYKWIVKLLLREGVDAEATSNAGCTALNLATKNGLMVTLRS
jgi:ankyrin repeat protein